MVPFVGGVVGESGGDSEIREDFGLGEGNNSFGQQSNNDVLVLKPNGIGIFPNMMDNILII